MQSLIKGVLENTLDRFNSKKEASASLNISIPTYNKYLKEYNLTFRPSVYIQEKNNISNILTKDWLIKNLVNTDMSICELSELYHIPCSTIESRASRYKLKKTYKHQFNESKFFDIFNPNVWYFAGLVATDGYLDKYCNRVSICLVGDSEKILLNDIKEYFELNDIVRTFENGRNLIYFSHNNIKNLCLIILVFVIMKRHLM